MSVITVRVKTEIKQKAMQNAEAAGLPLSTLINAFLIKFAAEGVVPFQIGVPETPSNATAFQNQSACLPPASRKRKKKKRSPSKKGAPLPKLQKKKRLAFA